MTVQCQYGFTSIRQKHPLGCPVCYPSGLYLVHSTVGADLFGSTGAPVQNVTLDAAEPVASTLK